MKQKALTPEVVRKAKTIWITSRFTPLLALDSFNKYCSNMCRVPGTVLDTGDLALNKTDKNPSPQPH